MMLPTLILTGATICSAAIPPVALDHDEYRNGARQTLAKFGVASDVDALLKAVTRDPRALVRLTAADLLTNLKERSSILVMRSAVKTEVNEQVRAHIGGDLLELQGEDAHALVTGLLAETKEPENRIRLAGALARLGDYAGYPDVLAGLNSKSSATQWDAQFALGSFIAKCRPCRLSPSPVDAAILSLKSPLPGLRSSAVIALSRGLDDPRVLAALKVIAAGDENAQVRHTAKVFLDKAALKHQSHDGTQR